MNCSSWILLLFLLPLSLQGQQQFVSFLHEQSQWEADAELLQVSLVFQVSDPYHIQADPAQIDDPFLIPTELSIPEREGLTVCEMKYPASHSMLLDGVDSIQVFDGMFAIHLSLEKAYPQTEWPALAGTLSYQTCDERKCFFPRELSFVFERESRGSR